MTTTGMVYLGPDDLKAVPYGRWTAFIGPGRCDMVGCPSPYGVYWTFSWPGNRWVLCEEHADDWDMLAGGVPRRRGHPDDGPGETF